MFEMLMHEPDVRTFRAGEPVFNEGDRGDFMYALLEGEVEIRKGDQLLERIAPGGVFGEMALIDQEPRSASAIPTSDCRVAAISQRRFTHLVQQTPFFAIEVMHLLADRLRRHTSS